MPKTKEELERENEELKKKLGHVRESKTEAQLEKENESLRKQLNEESKTWLNE